MEQQVDVKVIEYSRIAKKRRASITAAIELNGLSVLELGPLDNPTVQRDECDAKYVDWFSTEELIAQLTASGTRSPDRVMKVDYVVKSMTLASHIPDKFDLIIANHVIEHIPDIISWMADLEKISNPGCRIFLSVPDKRFTFDANRPSTDIVDVYRANVEKHEKADFWTVLRHYFFYQNVNIPRVWNGQPAPDDYRRYSFEKAVEMAKETSKTYSSLHVSVFTDREFQLLWNDLAKSCLVNWKVDQLVPTAEGENEFHVLLSKV